MGRHLFALTADLDEIGASYYIKDYYADIAGFFFEWEFETAIWYRGGPSEVDSALSINDTLWTTEEIGNYMEILKGAGDSLLMSQAHGYRGMFEFDGWDVVEGFEELAPTVPAGDQRIPWSAGLPTENGLGPITNDLETTYYFSCAPTNVRGAFTADMFKDPAVHVSVTTAERYVGFGSSGKAPLALECETTVQFCAVSCCAPLSNAIGNADTFRAGASFDILDYEYDPQASGWPNPRAFVSYGNVAAPDEDCGSFFEGYTHVEGPSWLWVVGYIWSDVVVVPQTGETISRAEMLQNILAWLEAEE